MDPFKIASMKLHEYPDHVRSRSDFIAFVRELRQELIQNPQRWENASLEEYLEAVAAWVQDIEGDAGDQEEQIPSSSWRWFCLMLLAATTYE